MSYYGLLGNVGEGVDLNTVEQNAFEKIISDTQARKLNWRITGEEEYTSMATVKNNLGQEITIPVFFYTSMTDMSKSGYLALGNKKGPCINTHDSRVKDLADNFFKVKIGKDFWD